jgi:type I restriction enzyme S subunit
MSAATEVPVGWDRLRIGECATVKRGASPRPIEDAKWWGGEIGWVRISDVTSACTYLIKTRDYLSAAGVRQSVAIKVGEVVMSICATIGRSIITTIPVCIHDGFVWFDGLGDHIDREYFYYYLASKEAEFSGHRQMGTQGNLNTTIVSNVDLLIPTSKPEQSKIAEILSTVDRAIEQTEALIAKQQRLKTGLMQDLLTRGIDEHGNLRSEQTHKFKDSPLGRIPVEWEVKPIETKLEFIIDYRGRTPVKTDSGIPLITAKNVREGFLCEEPREFIATDAYDSWMTRGIPEPGDVMITTEAPMGNVARVPDYKIALAQRLITLPTKKNELSSNFLFWMLHWSRTLERLELLTSGSTVVGIKQSVFRRVEFSFPPLDEQSNIAAMLNAEKSAAEKNLKHLAKLRSLRTALMQDLLTGRKRVTALLDGKEASA